MKTFTLKRFNRATGALSSSLICAEPEGFREMEEVISRDTERHGIFTSYSSELTFNSNSFITDNNNQQVFADAYAFIRGAMDEEDTYADIQLEVVEGGSVIFDLYLNLDTHEDDPKDRLIKVTGESREPAFLKDKEEQAEVLTANKTIRLPQRDIITRSESSINPDLFRVTNADLISLGADSFSPAFDWQIRDIGGEQLTNSFANDEIIFLTQQSGRFDFSARFRFVMLIESTSGNQYTTTTARFTVRVRVEDFGDSSLIVESSEATITPTHLGTEFVSNVGLSWFYVDETITGTFTANDAAKIFAIVDIASKPDPVTVGTPTFAFYKPGLSYFQDGTVPSEVLSGNQTYTSTVVTGLESGPFSDGLESFLNIDYHDILAGTPVTGLMLRDAFTGIVTPKGFTFSSTSTTLDHCFLTLGRRIAQATEEIEIASDFKSLFTETSNIFNIGYGLTGSQIDLEPLSFFYDSSSSYQLGEVNNLLSTLLDDFNFNVFQVGYKRFKEDAFRLYENESFNSKREYSLASSRFEKKLNIESDLITSNYIIEKLRRKIDATDDEKLFLIALNQSELTSTNYSEDGTSETYAIDTVAEGYEAYTNVGDNLNGLEEDGIINIRFSPRRIATRWLSLVATSLFGLTNPEKLGTLVKFEPKSVVTLGGVDESSNLDFSSVTPLFKPKRYSLETTATDAEWQAIKGANKYNLFRCTYEGVTYEGYILEASYAHDSNLLKMDLIARG